MPQVRLPLLTGLLLAACTSQTGPQGDPGAAGPQGPQGVQGPKGDKGDQGQPGAVLVTDGGVLTGPQGLPGASAVVTTLAPGDPTCRYGGVRVSTDAGASGVACNGAPGDAGAQGPAGAQGLAGSDVTVTSLDAGTACPTGGLRVTQLSDGGSVVVCNGAAGPTGAPGATGPMGPVGPAGAQGTSGPGVTVTLLTAGDPSCPTGGVRLTQQSDGGLTTVCNGMQGATGPTGLTGLTGPIGPAGTIGPVGATGPSGSTGPAGPTGAAGPTGSQGPAGPPGPAGAVLFVDGGVVVLSGTKAQFAGFTIATYAGNLGGRVGAHAICAAAFAGSVFCDEEEYTEANSPIPVPSNGAWIDNWEATFPGERTSSNTCSGWTVSAANSSGGAYYVNTAGYFTDSYQSFSNTGCQVARSLACCFSARVRTFRGFTATSYTGNLGGRVGAHALCASSFAGSHFCDENEYTNAESGAAVPSNGAWIDNWEPTFPGERSSSNTCSGWTVSAANSSGGAYYVNTAGYFTDSYQSFSNTGCQTARPLACCN